MHSDSSTLAQIFFLPTGSCKPSVSSTCGTTQAVESETREVLGVSSDKLTCACSRK